ncbi:MAG: type I glyceraldehyde-3-phosphate dehydrogenase [Firmicutes bacterium]|nr:type I glyceraldehyde-3-phosphate dehydrogenase [Bacillota bacterium]
MRVGINGFGRIGRIFFRAAWREGLEVVAVNDLADAPTLAHLLKYDSNYGTFEPEVRADGDTLLVGDRRVHMTREKDPAALRWADLGVDLVVESTGRFTSGEQAVLHIDRGGAKRVIISAPAKGEDITVVMGVNHESYDPARHRVVSMASCTTNCLAPVAKVLDECFGLVKGLMTTCHAYTNDQVILDFPHRDLRRARAAALSIIPTTTGAARAVGLVIPHLKGKLTGLAFRVPVATVSVVDLVAELARPATEEEINQAMREAAAGPLNGILGVCDVPLVSADFRGITESAIVDSSLTMVVGERLVKVVAWYDNEWGYCQRLVDLARYMARRGL